MNKIYFTIIICFLSINSFAQKNPKVTYEFPDAMKEHVRAEFVKICERGRVLYEMNCAKCHNTKVKGKWIIPDFRADQLRGYELRVANERHESNLPDEQVTEEELGNIMTFLTYKKKNK